MKRPKRSQQRLQRSKKVILMAIISKREIAGMDKEALKKKLAEIETEIAQNMGAIQSSGKPNNNKFRELKKLRASIKLALGKKGIKV